MLEEIFERLKNKSLREADYPVIAAALQQGAITASGVGAIALRDASNSILAPMVLQFAQGDPIEISTEIQSRLTEAFRRAAPQPTNTLPEIAASFTGRTTEEASIVAALTGEGGGAAGISALKGVGGVGKTALAVKIAHALTLEYPAAQLLIDLRGTGDHPSTPIEAMEKVIRAFVPLETKLPDDAAALLEIYRDLLRQNKSILILDNAKDTAQVASLLPPKPSCAIVTSRAVLFLTGAKTLRLDDLPHEEAKALLAAIMGEARPCADGELTQLAKACLRHPLSLKAAALFLKDRQGWSIDRYVARVLKDRAQLKVEGLPDHDVMAVLGLSLAQLETDDGSLAQNWRSLCVFPAGFDSAAAAAVWEMADVDTALDALDRLETRGFVESIGADRYRLHDLMRDLARRGASQEKVAEATLRHASHFMGVLVQADDLYLAGGDQIASALSLFDREWGNIAAGQYWAAGNIKSSQDAARLAAGYANAGVYVLNLRLHPRDWIKWSEAALLGNRAIGDRRGEGAALGNLGVAYKNLGETRKAIEHYEQQLVITREISHRRGEGNALGNLGIAYADLGETRKAIEHFEQSLVISRSIGDRRGEGQNLGNLGNAYADLGETRKAIEHYEQQLVITREIGDRRGEGAALGNLGIAYAGLGETRKAIEHHEQYLAIAQEIGDRSGEGAALGNLGNAYARLGETRKAIEHHEQYLAIAREIGDRRGEGNALGNLGIDYAALGETRKAIEHHEQDLVIARAIGDRRGEGAALGNLGIDYAALGETRKAIEHYEQRITIAREIGDRRGEGNALGNLGIAYKNLGETRKAIEHCEQSLVIAREIGDRRGEGNALTYLGLAVRDSDPAATRDHWRKALEIYTAIEDPWATCVADWLAELDGAGTES